MKDLSIALIGNPNSGKSTLFNALTGSKQQVGNWPGVTVERKEGEFRDRGASYRVVDLPGIYSLTVTSSAAHDEKIALDYLVNEKPDLVLNIVDASNLERNLYLTTQLIEMRVPLLIALNMTDLAQQNGLRIDTQALSERLGCPVVPIVAQTGAGLGDFRSAIHLSAAERTIPATELSYLPVIEEALSALVPDIKEATKSQGPRRLEMEPRSLAIKLLEDDEKALNSVDADLRQAVDRLKQDIEARAGEEADILLADARYGFANTLMQEAVQRADQVSRTISERIDAVVLNRVLGIPVFLGVIYVMFLFTINLASAFIDFFDILAGTVLVDGGTALMEAVNAPTWLIALVPKGIGAGMQTVATFIPIIGFLFLFLTFIESSGYMARAAFVMDRFMRSIGLPGKSFVPMILGFGCTVPAVMSARTLESPRDRIMTVMMAPFMSCGARLPVYALFAAAFFPIGGQNLVFGLYLIGIGYAVLTGLVLKSTLLQGETSPFVMELPPYHIPTLRAVLIRTWDRMRAFVVDAGQIIVIIVAILSILNTVGTDGTFGNENSDRSILAATGKAMTPIVQPLGITEDNWPATVGLFTGIFAKEAVVGTLDALYGKLADDEASAEETAPAGFDFWGGITEAFASIPDNLASVAAGLLDPLGLDIGNISSWESAAENQEVATGTFGAMAKRFDGKIGAFAYLLLILLYMPCSAAISAIYREVGVRWALFSAAWTTGLGYGSAVAFYQAGTYANHPGTSLEWLGTLFGVLLATLLAMRIYGARSQTIAAAE
ncbi:Fe(2+) transporter permease subunit FeoB [Hoeflea sp. TYP-13]|uniref:Fe(2+) transporter permease subunit FeoB n=1 Tax=Hoeflea sp. TYP-13 TaxID=3230023 RepID=UPI0034C6CD27